jgi:hypothetical protein
MFDTLLVNLRSIHKVVYERVAQFRQSSGIQIFLSAYPQIKILFSFRRYATNRKVAGSIPDEVNF